MKVTMMKYTCLNRVQILRLAAAFIGIAAAAGASAGIPLPKACEGNRLAEALPVKEEVNGYRFSHAICNGTKAEVVYVAGKSVVTLSLMDGFHKLHGAHDPDPPKGMEEFLAKSGESTRRLAQTGVTAIKEAEPRFMKEPAALQAIGGADFLSFVLPLGKDDVGVKVPAMKEARGDFEAAGLLRQRYVLNAGVKHAKAGIDRRAARQTIEPFLNAVSLEKLP